MHPLDFSQLWSVLRAICADAIRLLGFCSVSTAFFTVAYLTLKNICISAEHEAPFLHC